MKTRIDSKDIQNIWTRIFYIRNEMMYEIYFEMKKGTQIKFKIFTDYPKYREELSKLIATKDKKEKIELEFNKSAANQ